VESRNGLESEVMGVKYRITVVKEEPRTVMEKCITCPYCRHKIFLNPVTFLAMLSRKEKGLDVIFKCSKCRKSIIVDAKSI
jgi:hypothetical protein